MIVQTACRWSSRKGINNDIIGIWCHTGGVQQVALPRAPAMGSASDGVGSLVDPGILHPDSGSLNRHDTHKANSFSC